MQLVPLAENDRSWPKLKSQWQSESAALEEDFSTFAVGIFGALDSFALREVATSGLYGLQHEGSFRAFCQVSRLLMKKYNSPVLRARFVTVAPKFDLGVAGVGEYAQILVQVFTGVWLSRNHLPARHLRFHLRSPSDAQYFAGLQSGVVENNPFQHFQIRGAWIECTIRE